MLATEGSAARAIAGLFPAHVAVRVATPLMYSAELAPCEAAAIEGAPEMRRREFTAGRACARAALAALGCADAVIARGADRAPIWPEGYVGSISHSEDVCAAVAARSSEVTGVGLDVEAERPFSPAMRARISAAEERAHHATLPRLSCDWSLVAFSAKEALYKALFARTGPGMDFRDMALRFAPERAEQGTFSVNFSQRFAAAAPRALACGWAVIDGYVLTGVVF